MAAQLRRMKEQLATRQTTAPTTPQPVKPEPPVKQESQTKQGFSISSLNLKNTPPTQPAKEAVQHYDYAYVRADLRKIALLATAAIALEIALNLTTHSSFAKLILRTLGIEI